MTRSLPASARVQQEDSRLRALRKIIYLQISTAFCRIQPQYAGIKGVTDAGRDRRMARVIGVLAFDLDSHTGLGGLQATPPLPPRQRAFSCVNLQLCMTSTATYTLRSDAAAPHVSGKHGQANAANSVHNLSQPHSLSNISLIACSDE